MKGQVFELAERYTNMTKILFLGLWYCSIYPGALFMTSFILFLNYFVGAYFKCYASVTFFLSLSHLVFPFKDRFSLMRTWKRIPSLGTRISSFSRMYFFPSAIIAMAVVSAYFWSGFPFDNLCENDYPASDEYFGTWKIITGDGMNKTSVTVSRDDASYRFCLQDLFRVEGRGFPTVPRFQPEGDEWMTSDQEAATQIYGWTSLAVMCVVLLSFFLIFVRSLRAIFKSTYKANGDDQAVGFSEVRSMSAYIPQVSSDIFSYPLLACSSEGILDDLYDWSDPDRPFSYYDLTLDAKDLLEGLEGFDFAEKHVFSVVAHYAPPSMKAPYGKK
jgi:hypothetical protein